MAASDLLAWAEQLEALADQLSEKWRVRELRKIGMTPGELRKVSVADWDKQFMEQHVEPQYRAAGKILETAWRNCEFETDSVFQSSVGQHQSKDSEAKRHKAIFFTLCSLWLPTNREPGLPSEWTPVVEVCTSRIRSFAIVFRRRALNVVSGEQAAIDRLNQQNAWKIKLQLPSDALPHSKPPVPIADDKQTGRKLDDVTVPPTKRVLVTNTQVANTVGNQPGSMTKYKKEWGNPVVRKRGPIEGKWDFYVILPILKKQFGHVSESEWHDLETTARTT